MSWGRLDDGLPTHPKNLALIARGWQRYAYASTLWRDALCHAHLNRTRGRIDFVLLPRLVPFPIRVVQRAADDLVEVGLWDRVEGGYVFHDFDDYSNPKLSEARAEAGRRGAAARWGPPAKPDGNGHPVANGNVEANAMANAMAKNSSRAGARARPDPDPDPNSELVAASQDVAGGERREPDPLSSSIETRDAIERILVREYAKRYEREARDAWMAAGPNRAAISEVALYVVAAGGVPAVVVTELLDGFFADPWAREKRWPWKALAKDPARYRRTRGSVPELPTTDPLLAEQREVQRQLDDAIQTGKLERAATLRRRLEEITTKRRASRGGA